jgi:hypothetical protein
MYPNGFVALAQHGNMMKKKPRAFSNLYELIILQFLLLFTPVHEVKNGGAFEECT